MYRKRATRSRRSEQLGHLNSERSEEGHQITLLLRIEGELRDGIQRDKTLIIEMVRDCSQSPLTWVLC